MSSRPKPRPHLHSPLPLSSNFTGASGVTFAHLKSPSTFLFFTLPHLYFNPPHRLVILSINDASSSIPIFSIIKVELSLFDGTACSTSSIDRTGWVNRICLLSRSTKTEIRAWLLVVKGEWRFEGLFFHFFFFCLWCTNNIEFNLFKGLIWTFFLSFFFLSFFFLSD